MIISLIQLIISLALAIACTKEMPRASSVPLTKTFHVYYSKLKRSIITTVHPTFPTRKQYHCSRNPPPSATSQDFASDTETNNSTPPDFTTVFASHRFFFTSPGRSNSIVEAKCIIQDHQESAEDTILVPINDGATPIQTYSLDPFIDFRRSMQEMVEASTVNVRGSDHNGDYLHELVLCYLALNTKNTHRIIVDAFIDLLVSLVMKTSAPGMNRSM